ncbi:hypothetical protein CEUSTIGMA_g11335.t1 [Chlamydomonas eustigma]|uniref:CCHC-type domain-containing protein n=1 Tax=Chlamydomonas eustigma TaxID=1157962 RepID=A0A250XLD0_9CHLO|nr:hypothetical protein CEUSTIGMA_g11335.t1 [Chlamydomonas eustigma]|eukprot:GAX83911.1 hypothetical protein CEUSTIGMA_g11335.t1 [Chlamydomonas eustigma]
MSQKGVSEIFYKEASTNPQEAAIFDRLWGTLGNNVGTLFRSILTEAKSKASANENYALTAYKRIQQQCLGNLALQKSQLLREWHSFTQHPTESVDEYVERFNRQRTLRETVTGKKIEESEAVLHFLHCCNNSSVKHLICLLTTDTKPLYSSVEEAATKLRMDEFNSKSARGRNASSKHNVEAPGFGGFGHHESGPSSSSHGRGHDSRGQHYGKGKQNAGGRSGRQQHPSGGRGGGKPHVAAPAHPPNAPPPRNKDITCLLCQETGHMMRECPYKDIISSAISNHKRAVAPGLLTVTKAPKFVTAAAGAGLELGDSNSFVVDTGSAYHNVFDRSILHHFKPVTEGQERGIQMPNGMVEPILGTGSVYLEVKTPCGAENTAKYKGARFEDSKGGGKLLYKPGEAIPSVLCELHKNVHVMKCRPIPVEPAELAQQSMVLLSGATASEVKQYEAERLHRALGHPGNSALVKTLEGHVEGTSVTPEAVKQLWACEQCLAGKQTRNPFPDSGRATDWKLGELIVFDLFVALANVVSQHGYKYQLTVVDYYSRYCLVSFLSHKNDAFSHMKKVYKFVERQTGNNTKCFRIDRGGAIGIVPTNT